MALRRRNLALALIVVAIALTGLTAIVRGGSTDPDAPRGNKNASSGFPHASNTGVPTGTALTAYTGPKTITEANTVIDAKSISGDLIIRARGVKVTRSRIAGTISTDENSTGYSFALTDSDVNAGAGLVTAVGAVDFTMLRVHVQGGNRSVNCWNTCNIRDSYVHGQARDASGKAHESGIRLGAKGVLRHNTILCDAPNVAPDGGCSADLTGYGDFAPVENNTVDGNLFKATTGGYCAYGGSSAGKPFTSGANHNVFTDNVFEKGTTNDHGELDCGGFGAITAFDSSRPGNVWANNTYDDGTPVTP
jgi:hypothetical protein